ncbi:Sodium-coupled monocarboxylate transporter 2 [Cryptotermes secundus]|uniref:Sodium-coupled monocarboxylate transporter 2 n=1 Tax=Cryptotermes secundus TaxID=105785 RepID=A0A2J7QVC3_9NEOP|nr:sodium-coupled monocarboxylate transporter 2 [Cryptotermes secundus]PNF32535.1 Sodium-coupled monocarboxylate transporter 2 [Cryptotermes secundus]
MNSTTDNMEGLQAQFFGWLDFTLFVLMLVLSTMIGIYFGFWGKKEDTPKEYLHGGKTMSTIPVAVSLVASFLSGIMLMGAPTEVYLYGTLYWLVCVAVVFVAVAMNYIYLPVFYELQLTSTYEYLQLRFSRSVRVIASVLSTVGLLLYIPIVVYVPALAFSQVSGMNVHIITPAISILCIIYTMLGGIKAVVWTDFLQGFVMVVASLVVIVLGVIEVGGMGTVWDRSVNGGRIRIFEMSLSPFERLSFWNVLVGNTFNWIGAIAVNQAMVQKFLSLPTYKKAQISLILLAVELIVITTISCYTGLLIFASYHDCDPITAKTVSRPDQLLPYYVMDIAASIPGLPGLFVAGIFSAALSTMSSSLNALGATLFEDFIRPCLRNKSSDKTINNIIKCVVVIIGALCVLIVFVVDKLGAVLQLTLRAAGVTSGAMVGLFTFGMFYPRGNSKGALAGSISSLLLMGWVVFGTQKATSDGRIKLPALPVSVKGCALNVTLPELQTNDASDDDVFVLYRVSFMYYTLMGIIVVFVVGSVVSLLTEPPDRRNTDPALFAPFMRKYVKEMNTKRYGTTEPAEEELMNKTL